MDDIIVFYYDAYDNLKYCREIVDDILVFLDKKINKNKNKNTPNIFVDGNGKLFFRKEINNDYGNYIPLLKDVRYIYTGIDKNVVEKIVKYYFIDGNINGVDVNKKLFIYLFSFTYLFITLNNLYRSIDSVKDVVKTFMNFKEWYNLYNYTIELFNKIYNFYKNDVEFKKYIVEVENYG
ncbi:MAG: hypothetical protein QW038_02795 [Nanopusillaceae archaeon]